MIKRILLLITALSIAAALPAYASSVNAIERGGTIIACFTDSWIGEQSMEDIFSFEGKNLQDEDAIQKDLRDSLSEDEYESFISAYEENSTAEITVNTLELEPAKGGLLIMNMRRVGDAWYAVFRPTIKIGETYNVMCTVGRTRKSRDGFAGEYLSTPVAAAESEKVKLKIGSVKSKVTHSYKSGGLEIDLLETKWGGVAVIHAPAESDIETRLYIDADTVGIPIAGYVDGDSTVYSCVLTDAEYASMQDNAPVNLGRS